MGTTSLDGRGRVTIPKEVRDRLQLEEGTEFEVEVEGDTLKLRYERPGIQRVRANRDWGEEAFLDAGEALFGGGERKEPLDDIASESE